MLRAPLSLSSTYGCNLLSRLPGEAAELLAWPPTVCRQTTSWGYYALWDIVHPKMNISTYFLPFVSFQTIVEHKQRLWLSGSKKHQRRTMKVVQVFRSHMSYLWRLFFFFIILIDRPWLLFTFIVYNWKKEQGRKQVGLERLESKLMMTDIPLFDELSLKKRLFSQHSSFDSLSAKSRISFTWWHLKNFVTLYHSDWMTPVWTDLGQAVHF